MKRKVYLSSNSSPSSAELYNDSKETLEEVLKRLKTDHCDTWVTKFNSDVICLKQEDYLTCVRYYDFRGIKQDGISLDYRSVDEANYQWHLLKKLNKIYVLQPERLFKKSKKENNARHERRFCLLFPVEVMTIRWWLKSKVANMETPIITRIFRGVIKCMKYIQESDNLRWSDSWDSVCIEKTTNEVYLLNLSERSRGKRQDKRMLASLYSLTKKIFEKKNDAVNDLYMASFYEFMRKLRKTRRTLTELHRDDIYSWLYNHPILWDMDRSLMFIATMHRFCKLYGLIYHYEFYSELRQLGDWMQIGYQNPIIRRTIANCQLRSSFHYPEDIALFAHNCVKHYWENAHLPEKRKLRPKDAFDAILQMCPKLLIHLYMGLFRSTYSTSYKRSLKYSEFSIKELLEERIAF